mmetsp:Transcript_107562/g.149973  ORF Transcript_107562/g.149973 Transcript_107562/m.149973 type:complete len:96 (-) Transcript_107562:321-608(-)
MAAKTNSQDLHPSSFFSSDEFPAVRLCQLGGWEKLPGLWSSLEFLTSQEDMTQLACSGSVAKGAKTNYQDCGAVWNLISIAPCVPQEVRSMHLNL